MRGILFKKKKLNSVNFVMINRLANFESKFPKKF